MRNFVEQYTTDDKSGWGEGPWQDVPDKVVWVDPKDRPALPGPAQPLWGLVRLRGRA